MFTTCFSRASVRLGIALLIIGLAAVACGNNSVTRTPMPGIILRTAKAPGEELAQNAPQTTAQDPPPPSVVLSATPYASAMPLPTPRPDLTETYVVQPGDTLGGISFALEVPIDELMELNGLESESDIIQIGQALTIPLQVSRTGPEFTVLPDSEVVFSPAYLGFDVKAYLAQQGGYLSKYTAPVNGTHVSSAEIINRVARQFSVGPRVLLAILEHYGGWVTQARPGTYQPLGSENPYYDEGFMLQLSWAANRVNQGYYGYKKNGNYIVRFADEGRAKVPAGLNAGTAGILNLLAINSDWDGWQAETEQFLATYRRLFGDPAALTVEPLVPSDLKQPELRLPWEDGEIFYYTGGPHAAYGSHSAWAAVDFAPPDIVGSCNYSTKNVTAAADGRIVLGETGETYLDLDGDGNLQTGWVLLYLHVVARDDVSDGMVVQAGTPIGYASCEGGISNSSHLHLARRFNGEWLATDGPVPMVLSGWQFMAAASQYDGTAVRGGVTKVSCECWDKSLNAFVGE